MALYAKCILLQMYYCAYIDSFPKFGHIYCTRHDKAPEIETQEAGRRT